MYLTEYNEEKERRLEREEGRAEEKERVAADMLRGNYPLSAIMDISKLAEDAIRSIAQSLGIAVV